MKYNPFSRRMFLKGVAATGGYVSFGIPLLPSLLPRSAQAAAAVVPPRFMAFSSQNGGLASADWYPSSGLPMGNERVLFGPTAHPDNSRYDAPEHRIHASPIDFSPTAGISYYFDQKFNRFAPKMNFIRGLDYPYQPDGNHIGGPLIGNIASATSLYNGFTNHFPTIDQIMAYAKDFYPNNASGYVRSMNLDLRSGARFSHGFQNPIAKTGEVQPLPTIFDPRILFTTLFGSVTPSATPPPGGTPTPYVDAVMANFKKLQNGRAISSEDKQLLQSHIDLFADLEKKLTALPPPPVSSACASPTAPASRAAIDKSTDPNVIKQSYQIMNDMIILAFKCQRTRVGTFYISTVPGYEGLGGFSTDNRWHWGSHNATGGTAADQITGTRYLREIYKWINDNVIYDLVSKMESVVEVNGKTMLDNSLVQVSSASCDGPHLTHNLPMTLFGGAGGALKTGLNVDYQNRNITASYKTGLLFSQYLVTAMQAMGLTADDYSMTKLNLLFGRYPVGAAGYGDYMAQPTWQKSTAYYKGPTTIVGEKLPFIT